MAEFINNDFTKELSKLLTKYKKTIESDKSGIYIVDSPEMVNIIISKPTCGTEDSRDKLFIIRGNP